jgi:hypothetical protein
MEIGKLEEEVTVTAITPVIDAKKTSVGKNVNQEDLQSLPSARDPWVVMQMAPSIILDRENVGGSESGQQSSYYGKGDSTGGANNVWALDGLVVTDPAAIGASPNYWDFDAFEEMNITTGGADVTVQTGGVALNLVTRRGGNRVSLGGRFYVTDNYFQANNLTDELRNQGVININQINSIKDYGFNLGGPIIKDKIWLWGSYGVQNIDTLSIVGTPVKPTLINYNAKLNLQIVPQNRFEAMIAASSKVFLGRSASQTLPDGYDQDSPFHFGSPIIKIQDEHMFGDNLLLSLKFGYMNASFQLIPHANLDLDKMVFYDVTKDLLINGTAYYITTRPMYDYNAFINYFNDTLFGASHDIKLGVEYSTRRVTSDSAYPGDVEFDINLNYESVDFTGSGNPQMVDGMAHGYLFTQYNLDWSVDQLAAFFQDTITFGRFNLLVGVRYDRQTPKINSSVYHGVLPNSPIWQDNFDQIAINAFKSFYPDITVPDITPDFKWQFISPRIGLTYDLFGTGKTLLKLNFAMYGDFMGTGSACYLFNPLGVGGWMHFYWLDSNGNGIANFNELYWEDPDTFYPYRLIDDAGNFNTGLIDSQYGYNWGGIDLSGSVSNSIYTVDANAGSSRTTEYLATIEHELLTDFNIALDFTYRRYDHFTSNIQRSEDGVDRSSSDYVVAGQVPSTIPGVDVGAGAGRDYYLLSPAAAYTPFRHHLRNQNYYGFWGLDLVFTKRLSNNWMIDGSVSYMDQWRHYDTSQGILNGTELTQLWALQDNLWAPNIGGASGKINQYLFSHWMFKLEGLYQLPYGFDISFTFNARAGHIIPHYIAIADQTWANSSNRSVTAYLDKFGNETLPTFYQLNLRIEKMIKIGDNGRIYLMADAFNVLNSAIINRRYDKNEGTYYVNSGVLSKYANNYKVNEILNPFIARFGIRFQL